jgi:signal transduction histidine kinase
MPEDVRRRAVDPFFTTKPQGKGTGLGLSMTFGFVRQSGGYLTIESMVGRGTIITILMPRDREGP